MNNSLTNTGYIIWTKFISVHLSFICEKAVFGHFQEFEFKIGPKQLNLCTQLVFSTANRLVMAWSQNVGFNLDHSLLSLSIFKKRKGFIYRNTLLTENLWMFLKNINIA
jgi:hypothetical protein